MKLTKRLNAIASMIQSGEKVIDIGCDHALLDIYLTLYNNNICTASDINENALKIAFNNINNYNLLDKIKLVKSDGFDNIFLDNDIAVIAGMGTKNILNILKNKKTMNLKKIIVQTNTEIDLFRKEIVKLNFIIESEIIVLEKGIYYIMIELKKGKIRYNKKEYYIGPYILKNNIDKKIDYLNYLLKQNKKIINSIPNKYLFKKIVIKKRINWIEKELRR